MTTGQGGRFEVDPTIGRAANVCGWGAMAVILAGVGVFGIATGLEHWWGALLSWAAAAITAVAAVRCLAGPSAGQCVGSEDASDVPWC